MKGLTPVIAIVLILGVTISIAGTVMIFLSRTQHGLTEKGTQELNRTVGRLFTELKVESFDKDTGTVYIRNDGIETVPGNQVVIYVDDNPVQILSSENIKPNLVGQFVINMSGIEPGEHVLKVSGGGTGGSLLFTIPGFVDNPPSITYMSPSDGHIFNSNNVLLSCNATDDHDIENITLYLNLTGMLSSNETVDVPGLGNTSFSTTFSKTLNSGYYKWNCYVCDNSSQCSWGENRTFAIDLIPGVLQIKPSDGSTVFSPVVFNCSATDDLDIVNISLYANFSGTMKLNETRTFSGIDDKNVWANFTKDLPDGTYQWYCEACDSSGQCNITDNRTVKVTSVIWHFSEEPYRRSINVSEQSGNDLTDYQVPLDLNSTNVGSNFDWSHNGNDLRFTYYNSTSGTETKIPYWIEYWSSSTERARVWVKIPYIPASSISKIYMYYGNGSLSGESDGTATFLFFDDFNDNSLNIGKWSESSINNACGEINETNSRLEMYECEYKGEAYVNSTPIPISLSNSVGVQLEVIENIKISGSSRVGNPEVHIIDSVSNVWVKLGHSRWTDKAYVMDSNDASSTTLGSQGDGTYNYKIYIDSDSYSVDADNGLTQSINDALFSSTSSIKIKIRLYVGGSGSTCNSLCLRNYWDTVKLRKYTSPEPIPSIGGEENRP